MLKYPLKTALRVREHTPLGRFPCMRHSLHFECLLDASLNFQVFYARCSCTLHCEALMNIGAHDQAVALASCGLNRGALIMLQ